MPRLRRPVRLALAAGALALIGAACSDASGPSGAAGGSRSTATGAPGSGRPDFQLASALQPFAACEDLLAHLQREATERVTAYGLPGMGYPYGVIRDGFGGMPVPMTAGAPSATTTSPAGDSAQSAEGGAGTGAASDGTYSGTNTVEAGIDEGDTVKTDGEHLYLLAQNKLRIVPAGPGAPEQLAELALPGTPTQMVRVGDMLLIAGQPDRSDEPLGDTAQSALVPPQWGAPHSALWQVDVSDPAKPSRSRTLVVDGSILGIRLTDGVARVVVQTAPQGLGFVVPSNPFGEDRALSTNKAVIAESSIDDWLGHYELLDAGDTRISEGRLAGCAAMNRPAAFHGFGTTTVLSITVQDGLGEPNGTAVLADGQQIYSSPTSLYVAIGAWQDPVVQPATAEDSVATSVPSEDTATTTIHRFTFDGAQADYTATGEVTGSLMNDFSMSERDAVLRVATTAGTPWGADDQSESFVTTLRAVGTELVQVGQVGNLGKGERIYAVRFIDDMGYVVTFRRTDPLYVIDLRDPANPSVSGELKINGYSAYLHPLDDGRLIGIGQDADDTGRVTAAQVSIFDVSNPAAPTRTATYRVPDAWLNAESDYKAFLWWAPAKLLLLPAHTSGQDGRFRTGVLALDVAETITERGFIDATTGSVGCPEPLPVEPGDGARSTIVEGPGCYGYAPPIDRTTIVGDTIYSLSYQSLQANALADLAPIGRIDFR